MLSFIENILTGVKIWTDEHKQDKLTAGDNIEISGDTISAANDNSWREIKVNDHTFLSSATTSGSLTLSAGTNVVLTESDGVVTINSQGGGGGTTYFAGDNINIDNTNHIISAIGYTFSNTTKSFSESVGNSAQGNNSHAEGSGTTASGICSHAEGIGTTAYGSASHAEGRYTYAYAGGSHAEGISVIAGHAYGVNSNIPQYAYGCHGEGLDVAAVGMRSHAEGQGIASVGSTSHAEGGGVEGADYWKKFVGGTFLNVTSGSTTATISETNVLLISSSTYENVSELAVGDIIIYEGASVVVSEIEGSESPYLLEFDRQWNNKTFSNVDISTINNGEDTKFFVFRSSVSLGAYSHIEGERNITYGRGSHAEGNWTKAIGDYSHAEGCNTQAGTRDFYNTGMYPTGGNYNRFIIGSDATNIFVAGDIIRIGQGSDYTLTITNVVYTQYTTITTNGPESQIDTSQAIYKLLNGECSHAEGSGTTANGICSHAEGSGTTANGNYSHAGGLGTIASNSGMTSVGSFNKIYNENEIFSVGDGTSSLARSNAFTVSRTITTGINKDYTTLATVNGDRNVILGMPIGSIIMWGGLGNNHSDIKTDMPYGWLLCDGSVINVESGSSSDYDFAIIGTQTTYYYKDAGTGEYSKLLSIIGAGWGFVGGYPSQITGVKLPDFSMRFPIGCCSYNNWGSITEGERKYNLMVRIYNEIYGELSTNYKGYIFNGFNLNNFSSSQQALTELIRTRQYYIIDTYYKMFDNTGFTTTLEEFKNNSYSNIITVFNTVRYTRNPGDVGGLSTVRLNSTEAGVGSHTHSVNFVDQEMYKSTATQNRVASGSTTVYNPQHDPTGWQWTRNNSSGVLNGVWDLYENNEDGQGRASRHIINPNSSPAEHAHQNMPPYLAVNFIIKYM